jgi:hypothetical protein
MASRRLACAWRHWHAFVFKRITRAYANNALRARNRAFMRFSCFSSLASTCEGTGAAECKQASP